MKTPLLKSNLLIKPSIVVAVAVFTAAFLPVPFARAGTDPLMPTGPGDGLPDNGVQPFDPLPAASGSQTKKILTYGIDADSNPVPRKTLRIKNNDNVTVYPFLESPNTGTIPGNDKVAKYDPYDEPNKEYRGYIGYEQGGKYYFGLKKGESILVPLPLVFWNGGRIFVGTDSKYLTAAANPNPQRYNPIARRAIAPAEKPRPNDPQTIPNGVIMWYKSNKDPEHPENPAKAVGVADDSEDQLAEWTIRDHCYLSSSAITTRSHGEIPDNQLLTLINYDVSNVDTLYLPVAMETNDSWVIPQKTKDEATGDMCIQYHPFDRSKPNLTGGWLAGSGRAAFGWTGGIKELQTETRKFTEDNNRLLGKYFGGKGWPFYNIPGAVTDPRVPIKIPSGANIFPQSPFSGKDGLGSRSSYDNEKYLLSSGGTGRIAEFIGAACEQSDDLKKDQFRLGQGEPQSKVDFVQVGYVVTASANNKGKNPIPPGTTVTVKAVDNRLVTLSEALVAPADCSVFTFTRPKRDHAAEAMIRLWYSWAQYYLMHWKKEGAPTEETFPGSNQAVSATLTFKEKHPELVKGMAVTGPGLENAQTEMDKHQGDAVILDIAGDQKSVLLSQVMIPSSKDKPFTFSPPKALLWTPDATKQPVGYPLFGDQFNFSNEPDCSPNSDNRKSLDICRHDPYDFSQQVYLIMASMNQIGKANNNNVFKFMQDIIGANMGFIFTQKAKESDEGKMVTSMIRDMIKSVLRGVSDFTKYPDLIDNAKVHTSWYPNPAKPSGGQSFNVFNLDPFVWFVHVKLGFSGYGFSVDDDTADIGSEGQSLQLSVAGKGGLKNNLTGKPEEWSIQAPYGPLKHIPVFYSGSVQDNRTSDEAKRGNPPPPQHPNETLYNNISHVSHTRPITITNAGGQHALANGDRVYIEEVKGENAANGWFKVGNVTAKTFELFKDDSSMTPIDPTPGSTYIKNTGKWSYPLHPYLRAGNPKNDPKKVFNRVKGDDALRTFQGTFVSVNGVDRNPNTTQNPSKKKFRVWQLGPSDQGILILDDHLTDASGNPLGLGDYKVTFFGIPGPDTEADTPCD